MKRPAHHKRPPPTSGRPLNRRLAYKIYEAASFYYHFYQASKDLAFGEEILDNLPLIAKKMGLSLSEVKRRLKKPCYTKDQIHRAATVIDREIYGTRNLQARKLIGRFAPKDPEMEQAKKDWLSIRDDLESLMKSKGLPVPEFI